MLGGRYLLQDRIGGGGMAWVWRAEDTLLHRPVAIKVLREEFAGDEAFVRRFGQEAQAAASLVHPNVVHVYDVGQEQGTHYIVMELVEGETLKETIQRQGPMPVGRALQVAAAVARALQAAHKKGIVHRDIKPQNILLTPEGEVKVADFGIARAATGTTIVHTNTIIGSAHYFAPEQARGGFTDVKSDLYSVGAVLYEMLAGQPPFEGATPVAVALKHLQEEPVALRRRRPEVPRSVEAIVARLLAKDPAERYQSADALLGDLRRSLEEIGEPLGPDEGGEGEVPPARNGRHLRPVKKRRRRIWPWIVLVAVLVVLGVAGMKAFTTWMAVPQVHVANVEGMSLASAKAKLHAQGLVPAKVGTEHNNAKAGTVVLQSPGPKDVVKRGRVISLWVSSGPQKIVVPGVTNMTEAAAKASLTSFGFVPVTLHEKNNQAQGTVVRQSPGQGTKLIAGSTVRIWVSQGPGATQAAVPNFVGENYGTQVQPEMTALGVHAAGITYAPSTTQSGTVLDQSVPPGTQVTSNMTIALTVSEGPPPSGGSGPVGGPQQINFTYTGQGTADVQVWIVDATGTNIIYTNPTFSGSTQIVANWEGNGRIEVYVGADGSTVPNIVYSQPLPVQGGAISVQ